MRTKQITELEVATTPVDADNLLIVQNGSTKLTTKLDLLAAANSAISALEVRVAALEAASSPSAGSSSSSSSSSASSSSSSS